MRFPSPGFTDSSVRVYANEKTNQYLTGTLLCSGVSFRFITRRCQCVQVIPVGTLAGRGVCTLSPPAGAAKIDPSLSNYINKQGQWIDAELYVS